MIEHKNGGRLPGAVILWRANSGEVAVAIDDVAYDVQPIPVITPAFFHAPALNRMLPAVPVSNDRAFFSSGGRGKHRVKDISVGGGGEGDFSLKITEVSLEDDAKFQCQVARVPGYPGIQSTTAQVNVQVKPEPPVIINGQIIYRRGWSFKM